jgi:hypothetical protein
MNRFESIVEKIKASYSEIEITKDAKTKKVTKSTLYSIIIEVLPSDVDSLKLMFTDYNFSPVYAGYWLVGFKKPINFVDL